MSDYLNNLAARSLNLTEVIQPRLASRFEPPNSVGEPVFAHHMDAELMDEALTSGETDLSPQTPVRTLTRPAIEPPREARLSVPELRRLPLDAPQLTPGGLTTTPGQPSAQPTSQQPRLPTKDFLPPAKLESAHSLDQNTLEPTRPVSLQTSPSMLQPAVAQPSARSAPQQPEPDRSTRPLTADEDGINAALSRRVTEQESQPKLEPAHWPIVIERIALRQEPWPAGTGDGTSPALPRRTAEQEGWLGLEPAPSPSVIERIALQQESRPAGARDGIGAALSRSATQQERRPMRAPAIQPIDFEVGASPTEPPPTDASHPELPAIQDVPSLIPAVIVARPQVVPYVESTTPPTLPEPAAAPELAPTIQVTIGRIEVRATPPPAPPPQRQRVAPPVMSLDEYLRQRTRGGGR